MSLFHSDQSILASSVINIVQSGQSQFLLTLKDRPYMRPHSDTIWYDAEHQNGAVIRKRMFRVSYIEIYWGFVSVIQIWSY